LKVCEGWPGGTFLATPTFLVATFIVVWVGRMPGARKIGQEPLAFYPLPPIKGDLRREGNFFPIYHHENHGSKIFSPSPTVSYRRNTASFCEDRDPPRRLREETALPSFDPAFLGGRQARLRNRFFPAGAPSFITLPSGLC